MNGVFLAIGALLPICLAGGALLGYAAVRFRVQGDPVAEQVNALLPQTQCGQCGYPGCKPYAEAIAEIEKILARFRSEEMDVDSLAAEVKRATELIASCKALSLIHI